MICSHWIYTKDEITVTLIVHEIASDLDNKCSILSLHTHTHTRARARVCAHRTITKLDFILPIFLKAIMCHILFKILNMKAVI